MTGPKGNSEAKPTETLRVEGKQNLLFPVGPVKVLCYTSQLKIELLCSVLGCFRPNFALCRSLLFQGLEYSEKFAKVNVTKCVVSRIF